jgi:dipeptidyl-peptidase 4
MRRIAVLALLLPLSVSAQNLLPTHPRYAKWLNAQTEIGRIMTEYRINLPMAWSPDSKHIFINREEAIEVTTGKKVKLSLESAGGGRRGGPGRGRQFTEVAAPDKSFIAKYVNNNLVLVGGATTINVTTDGSATDRTKYGSASWVYGEELNQNDAIWWTADSKKLVFYRFDESKTADYFVTLAQGQIQNKLYPEAYPKAGATNPGVKLFCYDLASKKTVELDTQFAGADPNISEYIYGVSFAADGKTMLFHRTNRQQNVLEFCATNLETGKSRVIVTDEHRAGWVNNTPTKVWLKDGKRFFWLSERNGFANIYLSSLDSSEVKPVTQHSVEVDAILRVDEERKEIWYSAHSAPNPYLVQVHRVGFDGKGDVCLTEKTLSHTVRISPDGTAFSDVAENTETPRTITLRDRSGKLIPSEIDGLSRAPLKGSAFQPAKRFVCKAADGTTDIHGYYNVPSDFDPSRKYPVILRVYGGPESGSERERFVGPNDDCELGLIVAWIDGRGTKGRGRAFSQAVYKKLGVVEIDDQAAAMRQLAKLPFVDGSRIGIEGTSYGGYASAMALLRHPDVFAAAVASSSVTAWENYDTIYTERYMDTPQRNPEGYKAGSAMTYVKDLKGKLCLFYGTADDNVHPSNTHQLIRALDAASKPYRLYVGVDQGHAAVRQDRELEFFLEAFGMFEMKK